MSLDRAKQQIIEAQLGDISFWSAEGRRRVMDVMRSLDVRSGEKLPLMAADGGLLCWLIKGEAQISINKSPYLPVRPATDGALPIRIPQGSAAVLSARADCQLICTEEDRLDFLAGWEALHAESGPASNEDAIARLAVLNNPLVFRHLPFGNVIEALRRMNPRHVGANEIVVAEGDTADAFYVIESGRAEVWRAGSQSRQQIKVAELGVGDAFGEEALITGEPRNATVRMATPGVLLVLERNDFVDLIEQPLLHEVDMDDAKRLVDEGYIPIDVGYEAAPKVSLFTREALSIPLGELRQRAEELSVDGRYLTYCGSGRLGAVATMLLRQRGLEAVSLRGGRREWGAAPGS